MKMQLTCIKVTTFVNNDVPATLLKLRGASPAVEDYFGKSVARITYYRFVEGDATKMLHKTGEVDLDQFDIVAKDRDFVDETTGEIITRTLKYLYAKRV